MVLPFIIFWVIVVLCRKEMGWRWTGVVVAVWLGLFLAFFYSGLNSYYFVGAQALLDAILLVVIFKDSVGIR